MTFRVKIFIISTLSDLFDIFNILQHSASSFHGLSSSIFSFCSSFVRRPALVTSPLIPIIWCFQAYKLYIFCEDMILATCQCRHIFCCWVEPCLLLSSDNLLWYFLMTIFDGNFWWKFLMKIFYDNLWWQFVMTIFDDNLWWQFLMTIFDDNFDDNFLWQFLMTICDDNFWWHF